MEMRLELRVGGQVAPISVRFAKNSTVGNLRERICAEIQDFNDAFSQDESGTKKSGLTCGPDGVPRFFVPDSVGLRESGIRSGWCISAVDNEFLKRDNIAYAPPVTTWQRKAVADIETINTEISIPQVPKIKEKPAFPWIQLLFAGIGGAVMAIVMQNPITLVFMVMSPLLVIANFWHQTRAQKQQTTKEVADFNDKCDEIEKKIKQLQIKEMDLLSDRAPDSDCLMSAVLHKNHLLWSQAIGKENRFIRLGIGEVQSQIQLAKTNIATGSLEPVRECADRVLNLGERQTVKAPIVFDGRKIAVFGSETVSFVYALLLQYAVLYAPAELQIAVVYNREIPAEWQWLAWLPHTKFVKKFEDVENPATTLLLQFEYKADSDIESFDFYRVIVLTENESQVPWYCDLWVAAEVDTAKCAKKSGAAQNIQAVSMRVDVAEFIARRIAGIEPLAENAGGISTIVDFATLYEKSLTSAIISNKWVNKDKTGVLLGIGKNGVQRIDLFRDGPHALIVGTTGSGKSELLQTWITAMAVEYSPAELNFVFIDYKGGAAFQEFTDLPHTAGFMTDLDVEIVARVFQTMRLNINKREQLFAELKVSDITQLYDEHPNVQMPRLVIIVDEFAVLAREVPEFLPKLFDVATRGRSLGIHLIIATQHSGSHLSETLKANINMKIVLRVADQYLSKELLGEAIAVHFPHDAPGRAAIQIGKQKAKIFQSASVHLKADEISDVRIMPLTAIDDVQKSYSRVKNSVLENIKEATVISGFSDAVKLWNPPLPESLSLTELGSSKAIGIADDIHTQQRDHVYPQAILDQHTVCYGIPDTGINSMLKNLVLCATGYEFYVVTTKPNEWRNITCENTFSVCNVKDAENVNSVLSCLENTGELGKKILIIDGLRQFIEMGDSNRHLGWRNRLTDLLLETNAGGFSVICTVVRSVEIPAVMAPTFKKQLIFQLANEYEEQSLGVPAGVKLDKPGRAVILPEMLEAQFCA